MSGIQHVRAAVDDRRALRRGAEDALRDVRSVGIVAAVALVGGWLASEVLRADTAAIAGAPGSGAYATLTGLAVWLALSVSVGLLVGYLSVVGVGAARREPAS